ncbi:DUF92 domain-containing protein [Mucilaginibacter limnophilus]|uniref:DUF92 domain-containing protein n=1 Tax=Mucilaginibacter limnophilus TaxID=1932778 RepID=A0A437MK89_9SPHI|nr:DUF92 domain-containing protein [Mucilaginibacter limnophilus]RVT98039.1 DUF92 domain-containing protein [Mucilaginibacter limnophilus]
MSHYLIFIILIAGMLGAVMASKLTIPAALTGGVTGFLVYIGAGYAGISIMAAFFVIGSAATSFKKDIKRKLNADEKHEGRRTAAQVLANSGVPAIFGLLSLFLYPKYETLLSVMIAASLAAAMGDTLSSELGMVYGRRFFNILTIKRDQPGLDGVISLEGTLIGTAGSAIAAAIYAIGFGWHVGVFILITIAGTTGNLADSVFGAAFERKHYIGNNLINFLNTLVAALVAWGMY